MIRNEYAYYTGYYRNVRALGAIPALVFDTIAGLLRETGTGEIANNVLLDMLGCSKPTLRDAINKIVAAGYIDRTNGDGRGNKTVYVVTEKGKENCPFIAKKGERIFPKRGKNLSEKGKEICPINKELNKELKESGDDMREAQSHTLSDTTPQNFENMEDFNEFWNLYPEAKNFESERENCERVWFGMRSDWKNKLLEQLRAGKRWRVRANDNPIWYLRNYNGEDVQTELPFMLQGTASFGHWIDKARKDGTKVVLMFYQIGDDRRLVYVLESDRAKMEAAGAEYVRDFN